MREKGQRTLAIWALVIALCATSVAYAILQTALTISGSVTKQGGTWDIQFVEVGWVAGEELTTEPAVSGTSLSFGVTLNEPNDYVVIGFKIKNNGSIAADTGNGGTNAGWITVSSNSVTDTTSPSPTLSGNDTVVSVAGVSCKLSTTASMDTFDDKSEGVNDWVIGNIASQTSTPMLYLKCRYDDVVDSSQLTAATINVSYSVTYYQAGTN